MQVTLQPVSLSHRHSASKPSFPSRLSRQTLTRPSLDDVTRPNSFSADVFCTCRHRTLRSCALNLCSSLFSSKQCTSSSGASPATRAVSASRKAISLARPLPFPSGMEKSTLADSVL